MCAGLGFSQPLRLAVDAGAHAEEVARFESLAMHGPGIDHCAIWTGAIGADGYGRNPAELHLVTARRWHRADSGLSGTSMSVPATTVWPVAGNSPDELEW